MTVKKLAVSVLVASLLASCSPRQTDFAATAVATEFDGSWSGTWSWNPRKTSTVEIANGRVKVDGFPLRKSPRDQVVVLSAEGEARFQAAYGAKGAPCVLLYFQNPKDVVALFITEDKRHLLYDVSLVRDQRIVFQRLTR
jgi:hypothetical protein